MRRCKLAERVGAGPRRRGKTAQAAQIDILIKEPKAKVRAEQIFKAGAADPTRSHVRRQKTGCQSKSAEGAAQAHIAVGKTSGAVEQPRPGSVTDATAKGAIPVDIRGGLGESAGRKRADRRRERQATV